MTARTPTPVPVQPVDHKPSNVIEAIARVTEELGGIEKLTPEARRRRGLSGGGEGGGTIGYAYRGIDQIAGAAGPLFGRYGVVIVPAVDSLVVEDYGTRGKSDVRWSITRVQVRWTIYGPGGPDDYVQATTHGEGLDNSDKGTNKAMTTAFKNLLLRILCIGDPADDTDNAQHAADEEPPRRSHRGRAAEPAEEPELGTEEQQRVAVQLLTELGVTKGRDRKALIAAILVVEEPPPHLTVAQYDHLNGVLADITAGRFDLVTDDAGNVTGIAPAESAAPAEPEPEPAPEP